MVISSFLEGGPHRGTTVHGLWPNATLENFYERPAADETRIGAWCYADRLSYLPGETVRIHVCTAAVKRYDLRVYRDGWRETEVYVERDRPGQFHPTPFDCSVNGCGWPAAIGIVVPSDWVSGGYVIHIRGFGDDGTPVDHHFPIAIRSGDREREGRILLVTATATWVAYNDWGGSNFYEGITGEAGNRASPVVSTQRPFSRGFAWLPEGAPRIPLSTPPKRGAVPAYSHMDWAYANGFSKKYASAGWATYDRHFLRWAESQGLTVDVATQHDLHADAALLDGYATVAFVGHDEYWSAAMRDNVDSYVDSGGHVARFGGNFTWQIRIEDEGRRQVCYKTDAEASDPVRDTGQRHLLTTAWDDVAVGRPGTHTFGLTGTNGIYAGWGMCVPRGSGGFTVYRPDHWAFAGTDLYYGDQLGAEAKIFGYEVDGCDYTFRDGLPYATGSDGAPDTLEILAMGLATTEEADHGNPGSVFFIGDADARAIAHQRFRRTDAAAIDKVRRGSGMIACFTRGKGSVFNAASCEWVGGLVERDSFVERITLNVLQRHLGGAAKASASIASEDPGP